MRLNSSGQQIDSMRRLSSLSFTGWGGGRVPGSGDVGSGVGSLCRTGGCAPVPLSLLYVCGFFEAPFWQGK